jgi:hypothetical protein
MTRAIADVYFFLGALFFVADLLAGLFLAGAFLVAAFLVAAF